MKRINIKVTANAKKSEVIQEEGRLRVKVNAPATEGKANRVVIALIARYYGVKERQIRIVKGEKSSRKQIDILR